MQTVKAMASAACFGSGIHRGGFDIYFKFFLVG
jgi:hypothetical protein